MILCPRARVIVIAAVALTACGRTAPSALMTPNAPATMTGAWRAHVHPTSGSLAAIRDLEFLLAFNDGGTLTESSNYDAAPPVPPAYGVWRETGPNAFEATYRFYVTRPPAGAADLAKAGWGPGGYGVLKENLALAADGKSYVSTLTYAFFDSADRPVTGGGAATVSATRLGF